MKCIIRFFLLVFSGVTLAAGVIQPGHLAVAQGGGLTMEVHAGFDGYCHAANAGLWCPLYVVLTNEGENVTGELRILLSGSTPGEPDIYASEVMLPSHSRKAYFLYVPSSNTPSRLTVELHGPKGILDTQRATVSWLEDKDRLYAVAGDDPSSLSFLSDVAPTGGKAAVAHVSLETLPPDPLAWEALDVLIVNDVDTTALSREQRRTLEVWLTQGGHLIVGGGAGASRAQALAEFLPVTLGGTRLVDDLATLGKQTGAATLPGPYLLAESTLREGEVLIAQDGADALILLARRPYGAGKVDFLAFDANLNPFARWEDTQSLWRFIVGVGAMERQRVVVRSGYAARDAVNTIPGLGVLSTWQIVGFLLLYTLLIGPVNYIILRKIDRRELAWLTIPALILVFTAFAYVTGFQARGFQAIVHQLSVVYVPENAKIGRVSGVVGVFSPRRTMYDVRIPDARARALPEEYSSGGGDRPLHIYKWEDGTQVRDLRVDIGGIRPFLAEQYVDVPPIKSDLRLTAGPQGSSMLEGKIYVGELPLKNAVLIVGRDLQRLGDLTAGAEVDVKFQYNQLGFISSSDLPNFILGSIYYYGGNDDLARQYRFLQSLFPYDGPGLGDGAYLMGWSDTPIPLVIVEERSYQTTGQTFYAYALPIEARQVGGQIEIPPGLIGREVEETNGDVSIGQDSFYLSGQSRLVLRFKIWERARVRQVDELILELDGSYIGHMPKISLWNAGRSMWQELPIEDWGRHTIPNDAFYLIAPDELRLQLEAGAEDLVRVTTVNITIKGRR